MNEHIADLLDDPSGAELTEAKPPKEVSSGTGTVEAPVVTSSNLDIAALGKAFVSELSAHLPKAPVQVDAPPRQYTPEELNKMFNRWEPTKDWETKYDNLETRAAALVEMRDGYMKQADTINQIRLAAMRESLIEQFAPLMNQMEQQKTEAAHKEFGVAYPQLSAPELRPLLDSIATSMMSTGAKFASKDAMFDAVAKQAEAIAKTTNPAFSLTPRGTSPSGTSSSGKPSNPNAVRSTSSFGGGGNASGGGKGVPGDDRKAVAALFDAK